MSDKFLTEEDPLINNLIISLKVLKGVSLSRQFHSTTQGNKVLLDITDASFFNFGEESDDIGFFSN